MIRVTNLVKIFPDRKERVYAVNDVSFTVEDGQFYTLLGPSGCGKTTTLRCIAGLEKPDAGDIEVGGVVVCSTANRTYVPAHKRDIGMVFQSYAIWPHMSVFDNVAFPLVHGVRKQPRQNLKQIPGMEVREIKEAEICCGSAGIYNMIEPEPATELGDRKAQNILNTGARLIVTSNPGCMLQLQASLNRQGHSMPMRHPVEVLDASIRGEPVETLLQQ